MSQTHTLTDYFNSFPSGMPNAYVGQDLTTQFVEGGFMTAGVYDPQAIQSDAFARANHTGTQGADTITGLATVATSGSYADLSDKPTSFTPRVQTTASTATLTPNADANALAAVSAQAGSLTLAAPTGTPADGQMLTIRIRDNGMSRSLSWNAAYSSFSALPSATTPSASMIYRFMWNAGTSKWELMFGNPMAGLWG